MNAHKAYDEIIDIIAEYTHNTKIESNDAYDTARLCLADALGCAILALRFPACTKLLGPIVPGTVVPHGTRIPGTPYTLDPVNAAFNLGTMIRWLDFNDTWLAAEWGHPSDNIGGLLSVADFISRKSIAEKKAPMTVKELLSYIVKAHEIQGVIALQNSFNRIGLDHVILVKIATAAVATKMLGGSHEQIADAVSQAWIDIGPLRTYRHEPNTGSRKSWAAGDATSRGVFLAMITLRGEMGYQQAMSAKKWGFSDAIFQGKPIVFERPLQSYVMENVLFKVSFPAEFHAQTAVECAFNLYPTIKDRLDSIKTIEIETQESAMRIIDKKGILKNPADRDHCLQYMIAIGLLKGTLTAEDYEDNAAKNPKIDDLRNKMHVIENIQFSKDYLDPNKRSIANAVTIKFTDGSSSERVCVEYPIGHKRRRKEAIPLIFNKFETNLLTHFSKERAASLKALFQDHKTLSDLPVNNLVDRFCNSQY